MGYAMFNFYVSLVPPYDLELTCLSHGWVNLAPYSWDAHKKTLCRIVHLPSNKIISVNIKQVAHNSLLGTVLDSNKLSNKDIESLNAQLNRSLSLDIKIEKLMAVAMKNDKRL